MSRPFSLGSALAGLLALPLACGCAHSRGGPSAAPSAGQAAQRDAASTTSACFLLYELGVGEVRRAPSAACSTRVTPASTFKIPHALAALDSGVLAGPDVVFAYDGAADGPASWKRDHTLATATRYSVVWYFQRIAMLLGSDRERDYLARFDFGNRDSSSGLTTFWLDGSLRIAPDEEETFLVRLYEGTLPARPEALQTVRDLLVQPSGVVVNATGEHPFDAPWPSGTVVSAKTGSADHVRWLVGHVARPPRAWVFVSCVNGSGIGPLDALDLAAGSLRAERVL